MKVVKTQSRGSPLAFLNLSLMWLLRWSMLHTVPSLSSAYRGLFFCMYWGKSRAWRPPPLRRP